MTLFMIIPLAIIIVALVVIIAVIARKFPQISSIDVTTIPQEKASQTKNRILLEKLSFQLHNHWRKAGRRLQPLAVTIAKGVKQSYHKATELERSYRRRLGPRTIKEQQKVDAKTQTLVDQARELLGREEFDQAEKKFIDAIALDHTDVEAYKGLGELYWQQGNLDDARQSFEHVLKLNADSYDALSHLGAIARQKGELPTAEGYFQKTIELDSQAAVHYLDLADVYKEMGDNDKAFGCLEKAVGLEPNNPRNLDALLDLSILMSKKQEAGEVYARLAVVNPDNQKLSEFAERIDAMRGKRK